MKNMKLEVIYLPADSLTPYKNNAKLHPQEQIDQIKKSITEFGMNDPIAVWGENNLIVEGHGRLIACQQLGIKKVPVIRLDALSEDERRAYTLTHNKLTMNTGFDEEMLKIELGEIDFDMGGLGFDLELEELNLNDDAELIEDEVPEPPVEPKAKLGDIYKLGDHRLMCGDSTDAATVALLMDAQKADLVLTDPPYGINVVKKNGRIGIDSVAAAGDYKEIIGDETTDVAEKSFSLLKEVSARQIIWGGNYFLKFLPPSDGWIIWDKRGDLGSNIFADGEMAWCNFHTRVRIYKQVWQGMIREDEHEKRVHPTQKPIKLMGDILRDFSETGEIVLDAFGGSGTTLIACEQTGRKCYMMELDPKYCDVIIERWENLTGRKAEKIN